MSSDLTSRTRRLLALIGDEVIKAQILRIFETKAALYGPPTVAVLERVRFSVIKLAMQHPHGIKLAENLYGADTRDLLVNAEFATDLEAHEKWCEVMLQGSEKLEGENNSQGN
jgi:hypothetical protein